MSIALGGALISLFLGTFLGLIAGFYRIWATELMMRISDVLQAFPVFITAMILVALAGRETGNLVLALGLVYTPIFIRLTRSEVMGQSARGYVQAAWAVGNNGFKIAVKHVLPNSLVPSLVQLSVTVGFAIILTASADPRMGHYDFHRRATAHPRRMVAIDLSRPRDHRDGVRLCGGRPRH